MKAIYAGSCEHTSLITTRIGFMMRSGKTRRRLIENYRKLLIDSCGARVHS